MTRLFLILGPLFFLAACATLDEESCRDGDWTSIGYRDGKAGRAPDFIQQHAKACAEYGVRPDPTLWERGRQAGLREYCTPDNAYRTGARGLRLRDVCQGPDVERLERLNRRGLEWYRIGRDIDEALREISRIEAELADLPADAPERGALLAERSSLRFEVMRLRTSRTLYRY